MPDQQHRPDRIVHRHQLPAQLALAGEVEPFRKVDRRVIWPLAGDQGQRLTRSGRRRAEHQLRQEVTLAHIPADDECGPLPARIKGAIMVRQVGRLPRRLGMPEDIDGPSQRRWLG